MRRSRHNDSGVYTVYSSTQVVHHKNEELTMTGMRRVRVRVMVRYRVRVRVKYRI